MKHLVLYHSNCYDGFGAAYAAWKSMGDGADYVPVAYGYPPPDYSNYDKIYIVDFSYDAKDIIKMSELHKVILLDHHKTALEKLGDLISNPGPNETIVFDMEKSGAMLSWNWFFPLLEPPPLIQHIQDRDLWAFKLDGSKEIHAALVSYPMDFRLWDSFDIAQLLSEGVALTRMYKNLVENICKKPWFADIGGYRVPVVNTTIAWSEVGEYLALKYPESPFAASFTEFEDQTMWSLRSRNDFDVSVVAKKFGGGGHKNAAGFKITKAPPQNQAST